MSAFNAEPTFKERTACRQAQGMDLCADFGQQEMPSCECTGTAPVHGLYPTNNKQGYR